MRTSRTLFVLAIAALAAQTQAQVQYDIVDLGAMGGQWSIAADVNDAGQVVGTLTTTTSEDVPFIWENGQFNTLRVPAGTGRASAKRISETGLIVGWAAPAGGFEPRPLTWTAGQYTDIGTLGGVDGGAMGVSPDASCIVGWARPTAGAIAGGIGFRAFDYDGTDMDDLGTLPVGHWSQSTDANNAGQIVGVSGSKNDSAQATLFDPDQGAISLGTLGGLGASAEAINASGQVVGRSETGAVDGDRLVEHAFLWKDGVMTDLGALPGDSVSWGMDLNDAGAAVGGSIDVTQVPWKWRGWIWENGQLEDLNNLIDPASGWTISFANGINNNGWIVGRAQYAGEEHAVLLKPRP